MFTILHAPAPHKIIICVTEATFVTEYIGTIIICVSEFVLEFVLDEREVALNEGCQHMTNVCDGYQAGYTRYPQNTENQCFCGCVCLSGSVTASQPEFLSVK